MRARTAATLATATIAVALPLAAPGAAQDASPAPGVTLTLLHNNDGESSLLPLTYQVGDAEATLAVGGVAAYASVVGREAAQAGQAGHAVVNVYAGDAFLASATLACSLPPQPEDTPIYDAVAQRLIPYDAHVFGNHEFDQGPDLLRRFVTSFTDGRDRPSQPFLSATLDFTGEKAWRRLVDKDGLITGPMKGRVVARAAIVNDPVTGARFGIVGATTPLLPTISSPRNVKVSTDLDAAAAAVQKEIDRLAKRGIDKVILVSHLQDIDNDVAFVGLLTGVDIAVAGGGDELLASDAVAQELQLLPGEQQEIHGTYPILGTDADGRTVPIVTTAGNYRYVGRLDVAFDANGEVREVLVDTSYPRRVIPESQDGNQILDLGITDAVPVTQDAITQVVEPVQACLETFATTPIARSEVLLNVARGATDPFDLGVRSAETNGGDLVADSFLAAYDAHAQTSGLPPRGPDNLVIAVQNGGGIRQNAGDLLPAGGAGGEAITRLDTLNVLPFDNRMVSIDDLTAADLDAVLEHSCASNGGGGFLQAAGFSYVCDLTRLPGDQAVEVTYTGGTSDPADDVVLVDAEGVETGAGPIRLVTIDFTANGGDGYTMLADRPFTRLTTADQAPILYEQALREYLASFSVAGDPALPTIPADDPRYAAPEGEGRIQIIRE
jgi:5'-nucleotidase